MLQVRNIFYLYYYLHVYCLYKSNKFCLYIVYSEILSASGIGRFKLVLKSVYLFMGSVTRFTNMTVPKWIWIFCPVSCGAGKLQYFRTSYIVRIMALGPSMVQSRSFSYGLYEYNDVFSLCFSVHRQKTSWVIEQIFGRIWSIPIKVVGLVPFH